MLLSKPEILRCLDDGRLVITPEIDPSGIDQVSIDLRLGRQFAIFKELPRFISSIRADPSIFDADLWDRQERDSIVLEPKQLILARTLETIQIPGDLVGFVEGRSSWARLGISVHITAPKIDPGFRGSITLEMANLGSARVELCAERDKPAQLLLMRISDPLEAGELYGTKVEHRFQGQQEPVPGKHS